MTTISAGTLQLGDGSINNGSVQTNITDNTTLVFANPNAQTYSRSSTARGRCSRPARGP